jgi:hypothetical protein
MFEGKHPSIREFFFGAAQKVARFGEVGRGWLCTKSEIGRDLSGRQAGACPTACGLARIFVGRKDVGRCEFLHVCPLRIGGRSCARGQEAGVRSARYGGTQWGFVSCSTLENAGRRARPRRPWHAFANPFTKEAPSAHSGGFFVNGGDFGLSPRRGRLTSS